MSELGFNEVTGSCHWRGQRVRLSKKQLKLLAAIVRRAPQPFNREEAIALCYGRPDFRVANPANWFAVQLRRLRRTFEAVDPAFAALRAVGRRGIAGSSAVLWELRA